MIFFVCICCSICLSLSVSLSLLSSCPSSPPAVQLALFLCCVLVCVGQKERTTEMFVCCCDKWQCLPCEQRYGCSGTPCRGNYYGLQRLEVSHQTRRKIENINDLWSQEVYLSVFVVGHKRVGYAGTSFNAALVSL